jgi:hypothetical protein
VHVLHMTAWLLLKTSWSIQFQHRPRSAALLNGLAWIPLATLETHRTFYISKCWISIETKLQNQLSTDVWNYCWLRLQGPMLISVLIHIHKVRSL